MTKNEVQKTNETELQAIEIIELENVTGGSPCSSDEGSPLPKCTYGD